MNVTVSLFTPIVHSCVKTDNKKIIFIGFIFFKSPESFKNNQLDVF